MNRIQFGEGACERIRKYLDSYVSNELLVETNHEVLRHLESCPACAAEADARAGLRSRVKAAVHAQAVPPELQVRIREQIRRKESASWWQGAWPRWAAAAAMLVIGVSVWRSAAPLPMPPIGDRAAQSTYIQRVSAKVASAFKPGLADHIHCSIFRKYPQHPPTLEKMEEELGPEYKGLLPVMRAAAPGGYRVIMAHQCTYAGRKYVHLTLSKDGQLLSLVVARKQDGESMSGLPPASDSNDIPLYEGTTDRFRISGFEADNFLAYVVSELNARENLQIAMNAAPGVRDVLRSN